MKLHAPAVPLIAVDPYFSIWSHDAINETVPYHWTGSPNTILGTVRIDGTDYRFLGLSDGPAIPQTHLDVDALSTKVVFTNDQIELTAVFTSPLLIDDLYYISRPVSYLHLQYRSLDGNAHTVSAKLSCSEELVLDRRNQSAVDRQRVPLADACCMRMGGLEQKVLNRSGDNVRIDWGYFYLASKGPGDCGTEKLDGMDAVFVQVPLAPDALFAFAYDDIDSIVYFGNALPAFWKKDGQTITQAVSQALEEYDTLEERCRRFSAALLDEACAKGNAQYAELISLAYRQIMAAHKLVVDTEGNLLYISKECFSNGCAATVDITYPSAPLFLRYNTELLKAALRPVFRYANSSAWEFDFAPHDIGTYPLLNGQTYCSNKLEMQMPVEECGNMLILTAAICRVEDSADFALANWELLSQWKDYLVKYGRDPGNQLCTDDFAGHLAHNCNLSVKAIMGLAGYSQILHRTGDCAAAEQLMQIAQNYALSFLRRARNPDGSFRLAYDQAGTFSLKYNAVWDKLWGTGLFPDQFFDGEMRRYRAEALPYGIPLDPREKYTKSDWLHWISCMGSDADFDYITALLWNAYQSMDKHAPMCDWYYADSARCKGFRHRAVQGGLFMRFLFP